MSKTRVKTEREVNIHAYLMHSCSILIEECIDKKVQGWGRLGVAAIALDAFTVEAVTNYIGLEKIPYWEKIDRTRLKNKIEIIHPDDDIWSRMPWQRISELIRIRNAIAHGKPDLIVKEQVLDISFDRYDSDHHEYPKAKWEKALDKEFVKSTHENVELACIELFDKNGKNGEYEILKFGISSRSSSSAGD